MISILLNVTELKDKRTMSCMNRNGFDIVAFRETSEILKLFSLVL